MTNSEMTLNRFARWHAARQKIKAIVTHLAASPDNVVLIANALKCTEYKSKHATGFKAGRTGAYVQRGKHWDCFDGSAVRFGSYR